MSTWIGFFRVVTRHRDGYSGTLSCKAAANHPAPQDMARRLYMVPLPEGHSLGLSAEAEEWIATGMEGAA